MPESTLLSFGEVKSWPIAVGQEKRYDGGPAQSQVLDLRISSASVGGDPADGGRPDSRRAAAGGLRRRAAESSNPFSSSQPDRRPAGPPQQPLAVGNGQVKVGLILPLSAAGNAGVAAQSMKNAAEMALAEFQNPEHPAPDQGRRRQPARRAAGHPAGARRRRRDHSGSAVCAVGSGDRATDARAAASR